MAVGNCCVAVGPIAILACIPAATAAQRATLSFPGPSNIVQHHPPQTRQQESPSQTTFPPRSKVQPSREFLFRFGSSLLYFTCSPTRNSTSLLPALLPAMQADKIPDFLAEQREEALSESHESFLAFEDFWERKLWHQLTNALIEFFCLPESAPQRLAIFKNFILSFADKINQLKFVTLGLMASTQCEDDRERLTFLTSLAERVNKPGSQDAYVYATADVASVKLRLKDFEGARKDLDASERVLDSFDSVETVVHAAFYKVNADYYHAKLEFASYYKNALLYLACVDVKDLTQEDCAARAYDLSIAALVSDSIYNFGELLLHPVLDSLKNTQHSWLRDLLFAFNRGDLAAYDVLAGNISKNQLLEQHKIFLYQKISLAALTETVFRRPPHDRTMTFTAISEETKVQPNEIEHLIMKALSLGLLKGTIDQVAQIARISWVQPKVLDMGQIEGMRNRLRDWDSGVNQLGHWIEGVGKDVWAA